MEQIVARLEPQCHRERRHELGERMKFSDNYSRLHLAVSGHMAELLASVALDAHIGRLATAADAIVHQYAILYVVSVDANEYLDGSERVLHGKCGQRCGL